MALARRDTNEALRRFERLLSSDTLCPLCSTERLTTAQLLAARIRYQEAAAILNQRCHDYGTPLCVLWALERGRVNERLRNREKAAEAYQYVVDVWRNADPELQRYVAEAREGLRRLGTQESSLRQSVTSPATRHDIPAQLFAVMFAGP